MAIDRHPAHIAREVCFDLKGAMEGIPANPIQARRIRTDSYAKRSLFFEMNARIPSGFRPVIFSTRSFVPENNPSRQSWATEAMCCWLKDSDPTVFSQIGMKSLI